MIENEDLIRRALNTYTERAMYYKEKAARSADTYRDRFIVFCAAYTNAAAILRAALTGDEETLRQYEGA